MYFNLDKPIEPIQPQYPVSDGQFHPPVPPDPSIYGRDSVYPSRTHTEAQTYFLSGHPIAFCAVCPFDYNPIKGELVYYSRVTVEIEASASPRSTATLSNLKQDCHTLSRLISTVDNPSALPRYDAPTAGYEYLIVYDTAKYDQWLPLKNLYQARGMNVLMKPIQEIIAESAGADTQEKLRNYITSIYAANSLRYVFLAGDTDVIPHRGFYANPGNYVDADIPADVYYSSLDGNWNDDGDSYWGEMDEADLLPELAIGRFCYNTDSEISAFLAKLTDYLDSPEDSEVKSALFVGESLYTDPQTWGGDYMDELIGTCATNGYTTQGTPAAWNIETLYDRTYGAPNSWTGTALYPLLSEGHNFVNHMGHANVTYCMRISNTGLTTTNITNDGLGENFSIIFSQGCYSGSFDNRTSSGSYTSDCYAEKITGLGTAAVAMVANSRYGWYMQGSTNGSSQHFHREFLDAIFGEGIPEIGRALADSKVDNIPFTLNSGVMHWCVYDITLFGDPAMKAWTNTPQDISMQLPTTWLSGLDHYSIATNAPFANFRIKAGANFLYEGFADASGLIYVHLPQVIEPGTYDLYVNANNFYPWHTQITFQANPAPYITCTRTVFIDTDGLHHTGEAILMDVTLKNTGTGSQLSAGSLALTCGSPNILVTDGSCPFAPLAPGDSLVINGAFQISIQGGFDDLSEVQLLITASFDGLEAESHAWLTLNAPDLIISAYSVDDAGSHVYPGDNATMSISIENRGSGYAFYPVVSLTCLSPYATLSQASLALDAIAPYSQTNLSDAFSVQISGLAPLNEPIYINHTLQAENGPDTQDTFIVYVSENGYHFENSLMGFTTDAPDPGFVNQWHRDSYRNHSPNGTSAAKFGGEGAMYYSSSAFGALVSPTFQLGTNSQLRFYHKMDAEAEWDGGLLQMSLNGGGWIQLTPLGGYNSFITENPASPFAANTPVWSGSFDWTEAVFDLSSYIGTASFRWLFGSDSSVTGEGWYIDDVTLTHDLPAAPLAPQSLVVSPSASGYLLSWPAVTQDINGQPLTPDFYKIFRALDPYGEYQLLGYSTDPSFTDSSPGNRAFYRVVTVKQ
jgi:hypothetical protein